jgi:hypothetical protein
VVASVFVLVSADAQEGPQGLDLVLKGAEIGQSWEDFKTAHPDAEAFQNEETMELTIEEHYAADPLLGLELYVSYGFRENKLREYIFVWGASPKKVEGARAKFFQSVISRHGKSYKAEVQQLKPTSEKPEYAPALYWKTDAGHVVASYAETASAAGRPIETLTYAVFPVEDPLIEEQLVADELTPEQVAEAWKGLEGVLPKSGE